MIHHAKDAHWAKGIHKWMIRSGYNRLSNSSDVSFAEFIDYVLAGNRDMHWNPVNNHCNLHELSYDFILRVETLQHDMEELVKYLGLTNFSLQNNSVNVLHKKAHELENKNLVRFPNHDQFIALDRTKINKLYEMYKEDFETYGYGYEFIAKHNSIEAVCSIESTNNNRVCC